MTVQRGVYVIEEGFVDDFFLLQYQFPKGIYSHETALYLLGFLDRVPIEIVMTFPFGTNTRPIIISQYHDSGMIEIERSGGQLVKVYNRERTLVDLVTRYQADKEQLIPAFKQYARWDKKNVPQLFRYAKLFGLEEKIRGYMEVLL
ncbi:transcriptional regulator [Listeria innocua]|uniref:type IV toxin-antitoxin system AbiEi family antitoxin domain-containing protein n=1 Tax=Listeria innocua TaxID=1642 RepID=UPI00162922B4|nr:transcriptional regulator [Listeria innocua]MBC2137428.1 transcriptional regulator [Listeria innocua]